MRILWIVNSFPTEADPGRGVFIYEQYQSLEVLDKDILVISGKSPMKYVTGALKIMSFCRKKYDVIHCHQYLTGLMYQVLKQIGLAPRAKAYFLSLQNPVVRESYSLIRNRIFSHFTLITKSFDSDIPHAHVIPNGVNLDFFTANRVSTQIRERRKCVFLFISAGGIRKQKRIDRFRETIRILSQYWEVEGLVITHANRNQLKSYMESASALLCTSDFEGSSNAVKEAFSMNLPVFSTPVGDITNILGEDSKYYVADDFNPESLASLIRSNLYRCHSLRHKIIKNNLDIKSISLKINNLYEESIS